MGEIRTVTTLRRKREKIRRAIVAYEAKLDQAKADLSHVSAAFAIFEGESEGLSLDPAWTHIGSSPVESLWRSLRRRCPKVDRSWQRATVHEVMRSEATLALFDLLVSFGIAHSVAVRNPR